MRPRVQGHRLTLGTRRLGASLLSAAALLFGVGWLGVTARASGETRPAQPDLAPPKLLSLRYGRFRPQGAPRAYFALKLRVYERGG